MQSGTPASFDLVLRARAVLNEPSTEDRAYIALGYYLQALRADPTSIPAMAGAAAVFCLFNGEYTTKRAAELLAVAEAKTSDAPDVVAARFVVLVREGRTREALTMYNHLLDVNPSVTGLILQIGFWRFDRWWPPEEALPLVERTIRLNRRSANVGPAKATYGFMLLMLDRNKEALTTLEPIVPQHRPGDGVPRADPTKQPRWQSSAGLFLAVAYVRAHRLEDAKRMAALALQSDELRDFTVTNWLRGFRKLQSAKRSQPSKCGGVGYAGRGRAEPT